MLYEEDMIDNLQFLLVVGIFIVVAQMIFTIDSGHMILIFMGVTRLLTKHARTDR